MSLEEHYYCTNCDSHEESFSSSWKECPTCHEGHIGRGGGECCNGCEECECGTYVSEEQKKEGQWCNECMTCMKCCECKDEEEEEEPGE
jgi:hypothetical protein